MKKEFDAVEMMRSIRAKLNVENKNNPGLRKKRLESIRNKYKFSNIQVGQH